ncbi:hypothetical protein DITRI_Ditri09bG0157600 [Diplodiscus trichospermus]
MANHEMAYGVPMVSVVAGGLCVPYPVELIIKKKHHGLFDVCYEVLDVNGNLFFKVDGSYKALHKKRVMRDPAGFPILTMREKSSRVYQGDTLIAEVNYNLSWTSFCKGTKEDFKVKIYPGVDYALIVALAIILHESNLMLCAVCS